MKKKPKISMFIQIAVTLVSLLIGLQDSAWAELKIYTEENPPMNFTRDGKLTGLAVDVSQEILKRLKMNNPIVVLPWARAYKLGLEQPDTLIFATMRTAERENLFKWVGPITLVSTSFYAKKGSGIRIESLVDAKKVKSIGVPNAFYTEQFLRSEGFENLDIALTTDMVINKFNAGRNPVMTLNDFALPFLLKKNNIPADTVESLYTFMTTSHYFAFSLKTDDRIVKKWQSTFEKMRRDGTFARIYKKWLPGKKLPK